MNDFGACKRESHDSSRFYNRKLYDDFKVDEKITETTNQIHASYLDTFICADSRNLAQYLPDNSVHLTVTSPPYNVGKQYDKDLTFEEYMKLLEDVFREVVRVTVPGGRICINVANLGRKPYIPLHVYITEMMLDFGLIMRGEVIWNKEASAGSSCAWGSFKSASNPSLRDIHEYILIFSKDKFGRNSKDKEDSISKDDFMQLTKSIWSFPAYSAKKAKHPAPFPPELARRCIELYTFKGDVVLDPFAGTGNAAFAAIGTDRHYVMVDVDQSYVDIGRGRIGDFLSK
jgi:site-specific DNA-methyltransferase (adenine-specific)